MRRLTLVVVAVVCCTLPTRAQQARPVLEATGPVASPSSLLPRDPGRAEAMPVEMIPFDVRRAQRHLFPGASSDDFGAPGDTLNAAQVLRRIGRVYHYQSELLLAEAEGDEERAAQLLDVAMTELGTLLQQPDVMDQPRFRELYRTILTEYERYYGPSDSLALPHGDIFAARADMFAALNDEAAPLLEDVVLPRLQPAETVFPLTMNRLVEQSMRYLLRQPDRHIHLWLNRAETYFPMIEQIFAEEGVPDELKYLAMIESGLNPTARSWAQAVGMWQFISATGRAYGLDVNSWVDERMDPEKATRAAARHLKDLHQMFGGDWQLALAGYNCSPARIRRALTRAESRLGRKATFWDIYNDIPRETRNYVPMFIATALMASNPEPFNLAATRPGPRYEYDYVPVHGMFALEDIARMAGTTEATLRALNPELRRSMTPPSGEPFYIRLPVGTYERFAQAYAEMPEEERRTGAVEHTVRRGDTLTEIAARYGVSVRDVMEANGLRRTTIRVGQHLVVPVPDYKAAGRKVNLAESKPVRVQYGNRVVRPLAADEPARVRLAAASDDAPRSTPVVTASTEQEPAAAPAADEPKASTRVTYRVRRGDTLTEIAARYGVSVREVMNWNGLRTTTIRSGQRLTIHTGDGPAATPAADEPKASTRVTYRVRRGDTLTEIAARYGVSVREVMNWNGLRTTTIRSGQRLTIYDGGPSGSIVYEVRRGDTLGKIAARYGVSVRDLKQWNDLKSNTIVPGQKLNVRS